MSTATATTTKSLTLPDHSQSLCRSRLCSALRTALACIIVGVTTIYTPVSLRHHFKFPAFSYVTAVLIVGDATLGDTLRGAVLAIYATILGLLPAMLAFFMIRPEGISALTAAVAVAVSSFVVVVSDSTGLVTKRIALGQIVLLYVAAFDFKKFGHLRHPVPVAASTAVGVVAAVLVLVVPYPRLACYEVREKSKLYTEIATERMRLLLNAFCADNSSCMATSVSQAKSLGRICTKLLHKTTTLQGTMQWERPPFKFLPSYIRAPSDKLQAIETPLKGMEMALASTASLRQISKDQQQLKDDIFSLQDQLGIKIRGDNPKFQNDYTMDTTLQSLYVPQKIEDLPSFFFLFCLKLIHDGTLDTPQQESKVTLATEQNASPCKDQEVERSTIQNVWAMKVSSKKVVIALKCALTLGLAIFLGLLFSKDDGYWAGLTVAITFAPSREATFRFASSRAHGTALGSFFGVLGSLVSQNLTEVRLLMLVPWVVFTSFLQRSRMYGQGGAICAALSAMIIIGRRSYGNPVMFTVDRLTETYIGLCCTIFVELLLQPTRGSTLARLRLSNSLQTLCECVGSMTSSEDMKKNEKKPREVANGLKKYIEEAESEPNFWFLPFPSACYNKLHSSISKIGDLLLFMGHSMETLVQESCEIEETTIKRDLDKFKELVGISVKCLGEVIQERELKGKVGCSDSDDIEVGRGSQSPWDNWGLGVVDEGSRCGKIVASFLQHAKEIVEKVDEEDVSGGGELKGQLVLCFATIGFCMEGLVREVREMEKGILEFAQWENPSSHINLYEISCKIKVIST